LDKIQNIEKLFLHILIFSYLLLPLCYLIKKSRNHPLIIFLAIYGIVFFALLKVYDYLPLNSLKLYQTVYTFLEYSVFAYIFWRNLVKPILKKLIIFISLCFLSFQIIYFFTSPPEIIDSVPVGIETLLTFLFIILYFNQYFRTVKAVNIYSDSIFWFTVGILIYSSGSFFFNILANHIATKEMDNYWYITYIVETFKNILFSIGILVYSQNLSNSLDKLSVPYLDIDVT